MAIPTISAAFPAAPSARTAAVSLPSRVTPSSRVDESAAIGNTSASDRATANALAMQQAQSSTPSRQQIDQAMEQMRDALPAVARNLQFSLDEETGRTVVKVVDSSTQEVIRQIPSEELLTIARTLDKLTGLLLKQKA